MPLYRRRSYCRSLPLYLERTIGRRRYYHHLTNGGGSVLYFLPHVCGHLLPMIPLKDTALCKQHAHSKPTQLERPTSAEAWSAREHYAADASTTGWSARPPNVDIRYQLCTVGGNLQPVAVLVALDPIKGGDELRLDYQRVARSWTDWQNSLLCSCDTIFCRLRLVAPSHEANWWPLYRFERVRACSPRPHADLTVQRAQLPAMTGKKQRVVTTAAITGASEFAHCVRFVGLPDPVHIGDIVLLRAKPDLAGIPAQVLLFAHHAAGKGAPPWPWIAYRVGAFAASTTMPDWWRADSRTVLLTDKILVRTLTNRDEVPLARLDVVASSAGKVRGQTGPVMLMDCLVQSGLAVVLKGWATPTSRPVSSSRWEITAVEQGSAPPKGEDQICIGEGDQLVNTQTELKPALPSSFWVSLSLSLSLSLHLSLSLPLSFVYVHMCPSVYRPYLHSLPSAGCSHPPNRTCSFCSGVGLQQAVAAASNPNARPRPR